MSFATSETEKCQREKRVARWAIALSIAALALGMSSHDAGAFDRAAVVSDSDLVVVTWSAVIADPSSRTNRTNARPIPGARVEYRVVVALPAYADEAARGIAVRDDLRDQIESGRFVFILDAFGGAPGHGLELRAPNCNRGEPAPLTNRVDRDPGAFEDGVVVVRGIDLEPGESARLRFQMELR